MQKPRAKSSDVKAASACGCSARGTREPASADSPAVHSAHPEQAVGVDPGLKDANLKQLRRIEGQVRGIAAMIEGDRYCADVITQVSAVRESLQSVARNLLRNHLKHCATAALHGEAAERDGMVEELLDLMGKLGR